MEHKKQKSSSQAQRKITPENKESQKFLKNQTTNQKTIRNNYLPEGVLLQNLKVAPILRPNPDWEQDLANSTIIDDKMLERIKTYNRLEKKKNKHSCSCHIEPPSGAAPWRVLNDGRKMPAFGVGTWPGLTKSKEKVLSSVVVHAVETAIDVGYRHIDTAFIYNTEKQQARHDLSDRQESGAEPPHAPEEPVNVSLCEYFIDYLQQVGKAVKKKIAEGVVRRKDLFITTKLWNNKHGRENVVPALKTSLKLLNLTYVDLYLIHWPVALDAEGNLADVDYLETWHGMIEAQAQGLTRSIGLSNFNETQVYRILTCSHVKPAVLQIELNLNLQQPKLLSFCREHDILVCGFTPFGSVFKGAPGAPPPRADDPRITTLATKYNKTVAQLILRYIVELEAVPVAKWVTKDQMEENLKIYDFKLTQAERDILRKFDRCYRTIPAEQWSDAPDYPF